MNHEPVRPESLTVRRAAQILDVHTNTIYRLIKAGEIPAFRVGEKAHLVRIAVVDLVAYKKRMRVK